MPVLFAWTLLFLVCVRPVAHAQKVGEAHGGPFNRTVIMLDVETHDWRFAGPAGMWGLLEHSVSVQTSGKLRFRTDLCFGPKRYTLPVKLYVVVTGVNVLLAVIGWFSVRLIRGGARDET